MNRIAFGVLGINLLILSVYSHFNRTELGTFLFLFLDVSGGVLCFLQVYFLL